MNATDYAARLEELVSMYIEADNAEAAARRQLEVAGNVKARARADMARLRAMQEPVAVGEDTVEEVVYTAAGEDAEEAVAEQVAAVA
tara:strand:+ start:331 stop:591 length:261 start_codon:yes stop_codon:yes gene_type:complete